MVLLAYVVVSTLIVAQRGSALFRQKSATGAGLVKSKSELSFLRPVCFSVAVGINLLVKSHRVASRCSAIQYLVLSVDIDTFRLCVCRNQAKSASNFIGTNLRPIIVRNVNIATLLILALRLVLEHEFIVLLRKFCLQTLKTALRVEYFLKYLALLLILLQFDVLRARVYWVCVRILEAKVLKRFHFRPRWAL